MIRRLIAAATILSALTSFLLLAELVRSFWIADEIQRFSNSTTPTVAIRRLAYLRFDHGNVVVAYRLNSASLTPSAQSADGVSYHWLMDMPGMELSWYFKPSARAGFQLLSKWIVWEHAGCLFATTPGPLGAGGYPQRAFFLRFPAWIPIGLSVIPLLIFLERRRRRLNRIKRGLCASCGYSLIGNTTGVCPECGKPVEFTAEKLRIS